MFHRHRSRRLLRAALAAFSVCAPALAVPAAAHAGTFHVYYCHRPDGTKASMADWKPTASNDGSVKDQCPDDYVLRLGPGQHNSGVETRIDLMAPASVRIMEMYVDRGAALLDPDAPGDLNASPYFNADYGPSYLPTYDGCALSEVSPYTGASRCRGVAWAGMADGSSIFDRGFDGGTDRLDYAVGCGSGGSGTCGPAAPGNDSRATLVIHRIELTAEDDDAPTIAGAMGGSAVDAGGLAGVQTLTYGTADKGAGVYSSTVLVDGATVASTNVGIPASCTNVAPGGAGYLAFEQLKPCPDTASFSQSFDTRSLSEGTHQLAVVVRDAAGNATKIYDHPITVDNIPPPVVNIAPSIVGGAAVGGLRPGDSLVSSDGTWTGANIKFTHRWQRQNDAGAWIDIPNATGATYTVSTDDVGHALRVIVTATNSEGATSATTEATGAVRSGATVQTQSLAPTTPAASAASGGTPATPTSTSDASGNGAGGDTGSGQLVLDREQKSVDVAYGAKIVITGRLVDAKNQPIANAKVDVFEQLVTTTARWNKIDTITTDSQGGYVYRPKTTASRTLRFAWAATIGTSDYQATREVLVSVTAGMTIKAAHRTVGRHDMIRLKGRVSIDGLPSTGAWVELQVLDSRVWRTVATRKLSANGLWTYKHRLTSSAAITFAFRSRLRATGDIAAAESKSAPLKVHVR